MALETFLVEWKPFTTAPSGADMADLETFLVEWKLDRDLSLKMAKKFLETFLVEWKRFYPERKPQTIRPLKPS